MLWVVILTYIFRFYSYLYILHLLNMACDSDVEIIEDTGNNKAVKMELEADDDDVMIIESMEENVLSHEEKIERNKK